MVVPLIASALLLNFLGCMMPLALVEDTKAFKVGVFLIWAALVALVRARCCSFVAALTADSVTVQAGVAVPVLHRIPRRAVTGVQLLRTPLLWAAGCTVLLVRSPGLQLVLPGIPAAQATALAAVLMEGNV